MGITLKQRREMIQRVLRSQVRAQKRAARMHARIERIAKTEAKLRVWLPL
jgi:hypothetical protein